MYSIVVICIIGIGIYYFVRKNRSLASDIAVENKNERKKDIPNIRYANVGAVMDIEPNAIMENGVTFEVQYRHGYQQGDFSWFELEGRNENNDIMYLTVIEDDVLDCSLCMKKLSIAECGVSPHDLYHMAEQQSGTITYYNEQYILKSCGEAQFMRYETESGKTYRYWEFIHANALQGITIEQWDDDSYEASYEYFIDESRIMIYRNNADNTV